MTKLFIVELYGTGYGASWYVVVKADNLQEARETAEGKWRDSGESKGRYDYGMADSELEFDSCGVSQIFEVAW